MLANFVIPVHIGIAPVVTSARGAISQPGQAAQENFEAKADQVSVVCLH